MRAGFARCGGGMRVPGGAPLAWVWGVRGREALPTSTPRPLGGLPGPTTHWLWVQGGCGRGDPSPAPQRALLRAGFARCGGGMRVPGGAPLAWVWGVRGRALSHPRLPALWAGCQGPLPTGCGCSGGAGVGTRHQPHSARFCELALRAVRAARGRPGERLLHGCVASGVGRSPTPDCPPSGRAAGAHYPLAVGAGGCGRGDPSPTPQRALLRAGFARCGGGMRVPGGAPLAWVWGVRGRALSHPRLPALWPGCWGPLLTGCGRGGVRAWGPVTNPTARALASSLCALWGRHEGGRGGRHLPGCGASGVGGSPTPDCPPSGRVAGAHYPLAVGAGGAGVGSRHQPHSARSCELA